MGKKFEFRDHRTKLDIAGHIFKVDVMNPKVMKRIEEFGKQAIEQDFLDEDDDFTTQLEKSLAFMHEAIDSILGEGSAEKIFEGIEPSLFDMIDVLNYISSASKEARQKQFDKYSPERVKRSKK